MFYDLSLYFILIGAIINIITSFFFGFFVLSVKTDKISKAFAYFTFSVGAWSVGYFFWLVSRDIRYVWFWLKFLTLFSIFIPLLYFNFILKFLKINFFVNKIILGASFLVAFIFLYILFFFPKLFIASVSSKLVFQYWPDAGIIYFLFLFFFGFLVAYSWMLLIFYYFKQKNKKYKKQIILVLLGTFVGFLGGSNNFLLWYNVNIFPWGNIFVSLYVAFIGYAVIKYDLLGMRVFLAHFLITSLNIVALIYIIFSSDKKEFLIRALFFISIILISFFLKKSFDKEIEQKEKIAMFVKKLKQTNKKLEEIDRNKTEFISLASHQLRTPVTSIKGFISLANEGIYGELDNNAKKILKDIDLSADRLTKLIENLLNISRMEMGKLKYSIGLYSICDILKELSRDFYAVAKEKGIKFRLKCFKDIKNKKIGLDKEKIKDVLSNLIDNAFKYTEKGLVSVNVFQKERSIRIEVKDTGIGIEAKDMPIIFDKFRRGSESSNYNTSGLGIGIYLAKHIVEFHKGKIWAESKGKNKGSKFIVELPLKSELLEKLKKEKIQKEVVDFLESI